MYDNIKYQITTSRKVPRTIDDYRAIDMVAWQLLRIIDDDDDATPELAKKYVLVIILNIYMYLY